MERMLHRSSATRLIEHVQGLTAEATRGDAQLLAWLLRSGFPAERCAASDAVSVLDGQL
jgi:hypothetical protein